MKLIYSHQIWIQMRLIWTNKAAEFKYNKQAGTQKLCYVYCQTIFFRCVDGPLLHTLRWLVSANEEQL